jgi:undecaprenyl-diphosphatase
LRHRAILIAGLLLALTFAAVFGWLAYQVNGGRSGAFDTHIRNIVHSWSNPPLTRAMKVMSFIGEPYVIWPLLCAAIFLLRRVHANAWLLAVAMIGEVCIEQTLKFTFRRPRPTPFFGYPQPGSYSFPSGHALGSLVFFGTFAALFAARIRSASAKALLWIAASLLVGAIGFSRIYLGVHYPTDVIGGYAAALVWVIAVAVGDHARKRRIQTYNER